ncbi:MAG: hypothetical protein Q8922_01695 [Bacteroidota bacterium]|nr:hypothetical protein [Bacteroidota bacterium]MDP4232059.1 hypothetical protein [Bacteroidota bacterium]MDP4241234.1 hypothetical protein [Bacteroidota bacterium]MDP4286626.1 hypothetical protein [Bacteroidota bacterium]
MRRCILCGLVLFLPVVLLARTEADSLKPHPHMKWVARDSNALWVHAGPDTGRIMLSMKPYGAFMGHVISRDSNWVVLINESGLKQEIQASHVKGVSDWKEVSDTEFYKPMMLRPIQHPRLEAYFAPVLMGGMSLPNSGMKGEIGWEAVGILGIRIPSILGHFLGEFVAAGYETRAFFNERSAIDTGWILQYLTLTPGLSYRGLVSLGLSIEWPINGKAITHIGSDPLSTAKYAGASLMNVVLEPRLVIGLPLATHDDHALLLLIAGGYPLTGVFGSEDFIHGLRLPEVSVGISYVLPLFSRFTGLL